MTKNQSVAEIGNASAYRDGTGTYISGLINVDMAPKTDARQTERSVPPALEQQWSQVYKGMWVLACGSEIVGVGRSARKAWKQAERFLKSRNLTKSSLRPFYF